MLRLYNGAMAQFKGKFRVETARLRGWDYAAHAWYFVTACTHNRACYLGDVRNGSVVLSTMGNVVDRFWRAIPDHFPDADIDSFVIMPNHLHGIVIIGRKHRHSPTIGPPGPIWLSKGKPIEPGSLPAIIRSFKSAVTRWCALNGYPRTIWQPRYYEQIIRSTPDLERFRTYIENNPLGGTMTNSGWTKRRNPCRDAACVDQAPTQCRNPCRDAACCVSTR